MGSERATGAGTALDTLGAPSDVAAGTGAVATGARAAGTGAAGDEEAYKSYTPSSGAVGAAAAVGLLAPAARAAFRSVICSWRKDHALTLIISAGAGVCMRTYIRRRSWQACEHVRAVVVEG